VAGPRGHRLDRGRPRTLPRPGRALGRQQLRLLRRADEFNLRDGPPSTCDRYGVDGNRDGRRDIYDPADAIPSPANYLRALLRSAEGNIPQAVFGYNHSPAYVNDVLARAPAPTRAWPTATLAPPSLRRA
jgi:Transglycosylase SLT domain